MTFAILRIGKLKGSKVAAADGHNRRDIDVSNAATGGIHKRVLGSDVPLREVVDSRVANGAKLRKDGVEAVEIMLSASPQYFRPGDPGEWGAYEPDRTEKWLEATTAFLKSKYGERLVSIDLHLDEATPHAHAIVLPILEKEKTARRTKAQIAAGEPGRKYVEATFDAKSMFGPQQLRDLQSEYAAAVEPLGLQRGVRRSKARHEDVKRFYGLADSDPDATPRPKFQLLERKKKPDGSKEPSARWLRRSVDQYVKPILKSLGERARLSELYRSRYIRAQARAAGYAGMPDPQTMKAQLDAAERAQERAERIERENRELSATFDARLKQGIRDGVVAAHHDKNKRLEILRESQLNQPR